MRRHAMCAALALTMLAACDNAGKDLTLPGYGAGAIGVFLYLDRDGSGTYTTADTAFNGVRVALLAAGGRDTIRVSTSGGQGLATFDSVPLGTYRVAVDRRALGDSIGTVAGDTAVIRILAGTDSAQSAQIVRVSYVEATIAQVRAMPAGKRVFVRGRVTHPFQLWRDSTAFIKDAGGTLRILGAAHRPGRAGNNLGDSVGVLGTTGTQGGQPVLLKGVVSSLAEGPAPSPIAVSITEARTAKGGTLDAALVKITGAKIYDTLPTLPDFLVRLAEATDSTIRVDVVLDSALSVASTFFKPGLTMTVTGMLLPRGDGTWFLKPRGGGDITLSN